MKNNEIESYSIFLKKKSATYYVRESDCVINSTQLTRQLRSCVYEYIDV